MEGVQQRRVRPQTLLRALEDRIDDTIALIDETLAENEEHDFRADV